MVTKGYQKGVYDRVTFGTGQMLLERKVPCLIFGSAPNTWQTWYLFTKSEVRVFFKHICSIKFNLHRDTRPWRDVGPLIPSPLVR